MTGKNDDSRGNDHYKKDRSALEDWPYSLNAIEETLDSRLIEGRGKELLFRALNNSTLVGFVGSGMSAAYGRMSWRQLTERQIGSVETAAKRFKNCANASIILISDLKKILNNEPANIVKEKRELAQSHLTIKLNEIQYVRAEVKQLRKTFQSLQSDNSSFGDSYPIKFQIAKKLHDVLRRSERLFLRRDSTYDKRRGEILSPEPDEEEVAFQKCRYGFHQDKKDGFFFQGEIEGALAFTKKEKIVAFRRDFKLYYRNLCLPGAELKFKDLSKLLVYDETAHAESLIRDAVSYSASEGRIGWPDVLSAQNGHAQAIRSLTKNFRPMHPGELRRTVKGIRDGEDQYGVLGFFKKSSVRELRYAFREYINDLTKGHLRQQLGSESEWLSLETVIQGAERDSGSDRPPQRVIWTPTRRFVVGMMLAKFDDPLEAFFPILGNLRISASHGISDSGFPSISGLGESRETDDSGPEMSNRGISAPRFYSDVAPEDFKARPSIIHPEMDPLLGISMGLGVRNYITTNYDLEIERMLQDRGYRTFRSSGGAKGTMEDDRLRSDPLGGTATDTTFRREHASDLISHALDLTGGDASVFHLHGRATMDSEVVLTERDYMDLYLKNDADRDLVDESIELAFSANPILFLGIGLSENDVLRPLRQFVSDQEKRWDRTTLALMPAVGTKQERRRDATLYYARFGVHTIYYGDALVKTRDRDGNISPMQVEPFLRYFCDVVRYLRKNNSDLYRDLVIVRRAFDHAAESTSDGVKPENIFSTSNVSELNKALQNLKPKRKESRDSDSLRNDTLKELRGLFLEEFDKSEEPYFYQFIRDGATNLEAFLEGQNEIEISKIDVDFELKVLRNLFWIGSFRRFSLPNLPDPILDSEAAYGVLEKGSQFAQDIDTLNAVIRDCRAVEIGLDGIDTSIRTCMLSAKLTSIKLELGDWWGRWRTDGGFRSNTIAVVHEPTTDLPVTYVRHHLDNTITKLDSVDHFVVTKHNTGEPYVTGVRAFDTFLDAVGRRHLNSVRTPKPIQSDRGKIVPSEEKWRRIFLVAAHRGLGKGVFSSAFASKHGLSAFLQNSWIGQDSIPAIGDYVAAVFLNYSFSTEIASTWDMLQHVITLSIADVELSDDKQRLEFRRNVHRLERFSDDVEKRIHGIKTRTKKLNRCDCLSELLDLWRQVAAPKGKRLLIALNAVDLLFQLDGLPKHGEVDEIFRILCGQQKVDCPIDLVMVCEEGNIPVMFGDMRGKDSKNPNKVVNRFRVISRGELSEYGTATIADRLLASKLSAVFPREQAGQNAGSLPLHSRVGYNYLHFCRVMRPESLLIDNFFELAAVLAFYNWKSRALELGKRIEGKLPYKIATRDQLAELLNSQSREKLESSICDVYRTLFGDGALADRSAYQVISDRYNDDVDPGHDAGSLKEWERIRGDLRYNRFSLTLILAAANRLIYECNTLGEAAFRAQRFIWNTLDRVNAVREERREEIVVMEVLDLHETFHVAGNAERDHHLHLTILRHLAVMGQSASADVLVRAPEIRAHYTTTAVDREPVHRLTEDLTIALNQMADWGLVFRMHPHPLHGTDDNFPEHKHYRYALHRLMQRHVMRKMGGPLKEFIYSNNFSPTLYASMPQELPRPTHQTYRFLRQLVASFSQYPDRYVLEEPSEPWHFSTTPLKTRVQALRASLGILRSTFSIAVVSRFDEYKTEGASWLQHAGYFEEHRIQVRWLLRIAFLLHKEIVKDAGKSDAIGKSELRPFYIDEAAWLFNECGVICMVQGNLLDAVLMLRQALEINESVEGRSVETGARKGRICLNLAVVEIERGKIGAGEELLDGIMKTARPVSRQYAIACGYRGLAYHLRGERGLAEEHYREALAILRKKRDSRSCAIFCRHLGDLCRHKNLPDEADSLLAEAIAYAEKGGHEDLHKKTLLARIRADLVRHENGEKQHKVDYASHAHLIRQIEDYADTMDMPALSCEALHVRAGLLKEQGESTLAGQLIQKAVAKAKRNGLRLRLGSALALYGQIMNMRGQTSASKRMLLAALDMAKKSGFQLEIERIEQSLMEQGR